MTEQHIHYLSPKLEARAHPETGGFGVYARQAVSKGEILAVWGGQVVDLEALRGLPESAQHHAVQVEEGLYLAPTGSGEAADYFNHSCAPNAGLFGQITLVAMRAITPDEEVCFDYAMTDGTPYDEFECACGASTCRGKVTGEDWKRPELLERYAGYFSPYLQRRIDRLPQ